MCKKLKTKGKLRLAIHNFSIHVPNLLKEIADCAIDKKAGVLKIPLNIFQQYLASIAKRASELNDPVLNKIMVDMTMYKEADLSSPDYDKNMVDQAYDEYDIYMKYKNCFKVQDKYNQDKFWIIKKTKCHHYYINQIIAPATEPYYHSFKRMTKKYLKNIGIIA